MENCRTYVLYFVVAGRVTKNHNSPIVSMTEYIMEL
jgi:hypothetical protein